MCQVGLQMVIPTAVGYWPLKISAKNVTEISERAKIIASAGDSFQSMKRFRNALIDSDLLFVALVSPCF